MLLWELLASLSRQSSVSGTPGEGQTSGIHRGDWRVFFPSFFFFFPSFDSFATICFDDLMHYIMVRISNSSVSD